jgi:hypothetical protein
MSILPPTEEVHRLHKTIEDKARKLADETGIKHFLEGTRKLFYKYGLQGEVEITKGALMGESTLVCEIDGTGEFVPDDPIGGKVNRFIDAIAEQLIQTVLHGVENMIKDLIFRSKMYWDRSYKDDMTLAGSFSWSDPKGFFTWTISCSATIQSMHEYLFKRNEFELTYGFTPDGKCVRP